MSAPTLSTTAAGATGVQYDSIGFTLFSVSFWAYLRFRTEREATEQPAWIEVA